jgi:RNA polymerase sigma factor (sigma-70 family)
MDDELRAVQRREDAVLVERARADDPDAFGQLYDRWFDRVNDLAWRITGDTPAAGDVAQDAFLAAWQKLATLQDPEAFGGWLLRITRNAALDRKRREDRARPYDSESMAMIESAGPSAPSAPVGFRVEDRTRTVDDPTRAAEDGELVNLVWDSAAALGERDAQVLDLMLRHDLTPNEIGEVVGINRNAANQAVHRVRGRLKTAVEARVLWRSGEPACAGLSTALEAAGVTRFGPEAMRVTTKHAESCAECQERRQTKLEPSRMFAAVPMVVASVLLKQKVAHALSGSGVPMQGSSALPGAPDPNGGNGSGHSSRHRGWRRAGAGAGVAIGAFVIVALFPAQLDEVRLTSLTAKETPTSTTVAAVTTVPTTLAATLPAVTTATTRPRVVTPPLPPPLPPPETGTANISLNSTQEPAGYPAGRVVLTWSTSGGASVQVSGPGFGSSAASGSGNPCPPGRAPGACGVPGGVYTYSVVVLGSAGQTLASSSATLRTT